MSHLENLSPLRSVSELCEAFADLWEAFLEGNTAKGDQLTTKICNLMILVQGHYPDSEEVGRIFDEVRSRMSPQRAKYSESAMIGVLKVISK